MADKPKVGPPSKIIALGLEDVVILARTEGDGLDKIVIRCNQALALRNVEATVSKSTVKRYMATLDAATVPIAHQPQVAAKNAAIALEFGVRLHALDEKIGRWLEEADGAVTPMKGVLWDPYLQAPANPERAREHANELADDLGDFIETLPRDVRDQVKDWISPAQVMVPDWPARLGVARELRGLLTLYGDLMQRIHDAEEVKAFQESVQDAIREASPDVAAAVVQKLRERQSIRKAAILGA